MNGGFQFCSSTIPPVCSVVLLCVCFCFLFFVFSCLCLDLILPQSFFFCLLSADSACVFFQSLLCHFCVMGDLTTTESTKQHWSRTWAQQGFVDRLLAQAENELIGTPGADPGGAAATSLHALKNIVSPSAFAKPARVGTGEFQSVGSRSPLPLSGTTTPTSSVDSSARSSPSPTGRLVTVNLYDAPVEAARVPPTAKLSLVTVYCVCCFIAVSVCACAFSCLFCNDSHVP
jgi:hypothetical protein